MSITKIGRTVTMLNVRCVYEDKEKEIKQVTIQVPKVNTKKEQRELIANKVEGCLLRFEIIDSADIHIFMPLTDFIKACQNYIMENQKF